MYENIYKKGIPPFRVRPLFSTPLFVKRAGYKTVTKKMSRIIICDRVTEGLGLEGTTYFINILEGLLNDLEGHPTLVKFCKDFKAS